MSQTEIPGIRNGHLVDEFVCRGGDVTFDGLVNLQAMGVRAVACLKHPKDDPPEDIEAERQWCSQLGLQFLHRPMRSRGIFRYHDIDVIPALWAELLTIKDRRPQNIVKKIFVGCHKGSDRTGITLAYYRVKIHQPHWEIERALDEMDQYGAAWYNIAQRIKLTSLLLLRP